MGGFPEDSLAHPTSLEFRLRPGHIGRDKVPDLIQTRPFELGVTAQAAAQYTRAIQIDLHHFQDLRNLPFEEIGFNQQRFTGGFPQQHSSVHQQWLKQTDSVHQLQW